jgi:hypothetical protein
VSDPARGRLKVSLSTGAACQPDCTRRGARRYGPGARAGPVRDAVTGDTARLAGQPLKGRPASILVAALDDLPDSDADVLAVLSRMVLRRAAPAAIQQDATKAFRKWSM